MIERADLVIRRWRLHVRRAEAPIYLSLLGAIEADIIAGRLRHGDRLPAQRDIAEGLGVTVATVTKSLNEAGRRGIITARTGSGTFVRAVDQVDAVRNVDLSVNAAPVGPVKALLDRELARLIHAADARDLFGYEPAHGDEQHRAAAARWIARRRLEVDPNRIVITHGAQHALLSALIAVAGPGETVLCETLTYAGFRRLAQLANVRLVGVPIDAHGMIPAELERAACTTAARAVFVTPVLQNPTTATMPLDRRRAIATIAQARDIVVIEDDVAAFLAGDTVPPIAHFAPDNVAYITGFSKCVAPGFRLGFVQAPQRYAQAMRAALVGSNWTAPSFYAAFATMLIESGIADECVALQRREASVRCAIARDVLGERASCAQPGYHLWLPTPVRSAHEITAQALQSGVRISPSRHFAVSDDVAVQSAVRVSLGPCEDQADLRYALGVVARALGAAAAPTETIA